MIALRRKDERGHFDHGWLRTYHTFSFADYMDPEFMGFRTLRVINEDFVAPGAGFPTHAHRDMEIVTYVLEGSLQHRDSMGNGSIIRPGEVQRMTAGRGVTHSEQNASESEWLHLLQIWILPERSRLDPGYEQKFFSEEERRGQLRVVASRDGRDGSVTIHQDAAIFSSILGAGDRLKLPVDSSRHAWLQVARGEMTLGPEHRLQQGDAAYWTGGPAMTIEASADSEILLFDLA